MERYAPGDYNQEYLLAGAAQRYEQSLADDMRYEEAQREQQVRQEQLARRRQRDEEASAIAREDALRARQASEESVRMANENMEQQRRYVRDRLGHARMYSTVGDEEGTDRIYHELSEWASKRRIPRRSLDQRELSEAIEYRRLVDINHRTMHLFEHKWFEDDLAQAGYLHPYMSERQADDLRLVRYANSAEAVDTLGRRAVGEDWRTAVPPELVDDPNLPRLRPAAHLDYPHVPYQTQRDKTKKDALLARRLRQGY